MKRIALFLLWVSTTLALSCSKKNSTPAYPDGNGQGANPIKRPHGNPTGPAVSKQIGPSGGKLISTDGTISLELPAGAVEAPVNFSIQPIENTLLESPGKAYRLLPEGVQFSKPVTITYTLSDQEAKALNPDILFLAYQDAEGHHYLAANSEMNSTGDKVSVQTTHFSDWTIAELLDVVADTTQVSPGGKANLKLMWQLGSLLGPLTQDQPIGDLTEYDGYVSKVSWSLAAGKGNIQPDGTRCMYKAPGTVPAENPALVSVSVPITMYKANRKAICILTRSITTVPDEYMMLNVDGEIMINKAPENGESWLNMEADKFYISARMQNDHSIYLLIPGGVTATGSYPYGENEKEAYIDYSLDEGDIDNTYITEKRNCETCDLVYSGGQVKITRFGAVGDYVEGEFTAELWLMGYYNPPKKNVTGKFRVKRN